MPERDPTGTRRGPELLRLAAAPEPPPSRRLDFLREARFTYPTQHGAPMPNGYADDASANPRGPLALGREQAPGDTWNRGLQGVRFVRR